MEQLYDGTTGRPLESLTLVGKCFYQILDHIVDHKGSAVGKLNARPHYYYQRHMENATSLGGMEIQTLETHGMCSVVEEVFKPDRITIRVCKSCRMDAEAHDQKCFYCCRENSFEEYETSFSLKLLRDEYMSMNMHCPISTSVIDEEQDEDEDMEGADVRQEDDDDDENEVIYVRRRKKTRIASFDSESD